MTLQSGSASHSPAPHSPGPRNPARLPPAGGLPQRGLFDLAGPVGREAANDRDDVIRAQLMLEAAGYLDPGRLPGPTGWPGDGLVRAIRAWQKDNGLTVDGVLMPEGWNGDPRNGETLRSLKARHGKTLAGTPVPTAADVDARFERDARMEANPEAAAGTVLSDEPDSPPAMQPEPGQQMAALPLLAVPAAAAVVRAAPLVLRGVIAAQQMTQQAMRKKPDPAAAGAPRSLLQDWQPDATEDDAARRSAFTSMPGDIRTPPSEPVSEGDKALTKNPPLVPTAPPADPLRGRPAEPMEPVRTPPFLTPEMKEWIGRLPPQEQPFAKDLLGIIVESNPHGIRGKPDTVKSNILAAKACQAVLVEFPRLQGITHVAGSYNAKTGKYQKEEVIRTDPASSSQRGSSRPDNTHVDQKNPDLAGRMNTVDILKTGSDRIETETMTANEQRRYDRLVANLKEGVAGWARKIKPGESDKAYTRYVTIRCRQMWQRLEKNLDAENTLKPMGNSRAQ